MSGISTIVQINSSASGKTATHPSRPDRGAEPGMALEAVERHARSQRKNQEEQQHDEPGRDVPQHAVVGSERRPVGRRRPGHDRVDHVAADRVDLSGDDRAGALVKVAADDVDVAVDLAGNGGVAGKDGEVTLDRLSRFDDHRADIGSAVIDARCARERRSGECRESAQDERGDGR